VLVLLVVLVKGAGMDGARGVGRLDARCERTWNTAKRWRPRRLTSAAAVQEGWLEMTITFDLVDSLEPADQIGLKGDPTVSEALSGGASRREHIGQTRRGVEKW
jgi:hypothetical protein